MKPYDHCSFCGVRYAATDWPRRCLTCKQVTYRNPTPVVVLLVAVLKPDGETHLLVIRRGIEPGKGLLALPGGYMEMGETWQEAGARELREETGIIVNPATLSLHDVRANSPKTCVLIFGVTQPVEPPTLFVPNHEVSEIVVLAPTDNHDLAFSTHSEAARWFFHGPGR